MRFRTHTGEIVEGARLAVAVNAVADDLIRSARAIHLEDAYASHVTQVQKIEYLDKRLALAKEVRAGRVDLGQFWLWQRINIELTGKCIPLFSDAK